MLALFDGDHENRRKVEFVLVGGYTLPFLINEAEREDGSAENWNFKGLYQMGSGYYPVFGFFSTRTRQGWVELNG
ncbi:hypothetical protein A2442_01245 [Candidatus Campbellbacteria bacterium RIFOXYC2_FULL_35_25]|uniref:Uncharacterized protein n=1 Tax=Candidatus Campbellbacteria bacterium RIFOXYC2_FULL_35_25 TaxID=1797582 RepID=A0A1F5EHR2_9BACT|nr:MAG: hypothetical protein A2442_01245 [Candidatus Campbellbacteria bacterium RIFOXYC2_FULL_35_25]